MSKNFSKSPRKERFLLTVPKDSLSNCDILTRSKFNFSYFNNNHPGQDFVDWNNAGGNSKLVKLMGKLKEFTREPLKHWENEKIGKGKNAGKGKRQSCLEVYKDFPARSAFSHPQNVPIDVWWARFRIDSDTRLVGFVIPDNLDKAIASNFDYNTFYVVFLDDKHQFYLT
ncbi:MULTISPECIES: hypothetical protein [Aeromonas]|uniref:hypothetical protein n=1 Tax=Aeromonas TaxID=642 RepID=UPI00131A510F|nr:hypothetical protein [Aeromonas hydrophila]